MIIKRRIQDNIPSRIIESLDGLQLEFGAHMRFMYGKAYDWWMKATC